ncbi:MAG: hypothetical protein C0412_20795 [Flavobacterium sp.]|nr:hypothetical protein [Flavobacterium sp.]
MGGFEKDDHLLKTKLVLKATDKFTDEQAERVFENTEIKSENDTEELINYLKQYRPKLFKKFKLILLNVSTR